MSFRRMNNMNNNENSYIFLIKPDDVSVNELDSHVVKWDLPLSEKQKSAIQEGDTIYIYLGAYGKFSNNISLQNRIAYVGKIKKFENEGEKIKNHSYRRVFMDIKEIAFDATEKLSYDINRLKGYKRKNKQFLEEDTLGFNPKALQGHMIDLQESKYTELKKYIELILQENYAYTDKLDHRMAFNNLHHKYDYIFKEKFSNTVAAKARKINKLSGNIATYLVKQYIEKMIRTRPLKVSEPNSYILGVNAEYDLLLLKKDAKPIKEMNIFSPEDVEGVVEVKNSGLFGVRKKTNNEQKTLKDEVDFILQAYKSALKLNKTIKFAYITLRENNKSNDQNDYLSLTEKYFRDNDKNYGRAFCFEPIYDDYNNPNVHRPEYNDWPEFIHTCLF